MNSSLIVGRKSFFLTVAILILNGFLAHAADSVLNGGDIHLIHQVANEIHKRGDLAFFTTQENDRSLIWHPKALEDNFRDYGIEIKKSVGACIGKSSQANSDCLLGLHSALSLIDRVKIVAVESPTIQGNRHSATNHRNLLEIQINKWHWRSLSDVVCTRGSPAQRPGIAKKIKELLVIHEFLSIAGRDDSFYLLTKQCQLEFEDCLN